MEIATYGKKEKKLKAGQLRRYLRGLIREGRDWWCETVNVIDCGTGERG